MRLHRAAQHVDTHILAEGGGAGAERRRLVEQAWAGPVRSVMADFEAEMPPAVDEVGSAGEPQRQTLRQED